MRKVSLIGLLLMLSTSVYASPYIGVEGGAMVSQDAQAPTYGLRVGNVIKGWDVSGGYWSAIKMKNNDILSHDLDLHTVDAELYRIFPINQGLSANLGGGIGYTIPSMGNGADTADNGASFSVGGGADYDLSNDYSVGIGASWFLFTTDTHITVYGSHMETLSNGADVEVLDVTHYNNSVNFNAVRLVVALYWK